MIEIVGRRSRLLNLGLIALAAAGASRASPARAGRFSSPAWLAALGVDDRTAACRFSACKRAQPSSRERVLAHRRERLRRPADLLHGLARGGAHRSVLDGGAHRQHPGQSPMSSMSRSAISQRADRLATRLLDGMSITSSIGAGLAHAGPATSTEERYRADQHRKRRCALARSRARPASVAALRLPVLDPGAERRIDQRPFPLTEAEPRLPRPTPMAAPSLRLNSGLARVRSRLGGTAAGAGLRPRRESEHGGAAEAGAKLPDAAAARRALCQTAFAARDREPRRAPIALRLDAGRWSGAAQLHRLGSGALIGRRRCLPQMRAGLGRRAGLLIPVPSSLPGSLTAAALGAQRRGYERKLAKAVSSPQPDSAAQVLAGSRFCRRREAALRAAGGKPGRRRLKSGIAVFEHSLRRRA